MLIIMMALIGVVALIVVGLRRDKISLLILALCGSFIAMLAGIVIYTAKIGGFSRNQQILLFLLPNIQQYLQYLPITLDVQGYAAAVGRCCVSLYSASDFPQLFYEHSGAQTYEKIKNSGVYCLSLIHI